jgi:hypothetical protein
MAVVLDMSMMMAALDGLGAFKLYFKMDTYIRLDETTDGHHFPNPNTKVSF